MRYDLTDLKVFLAVVEAGNLSRGAERSHLSPSSVSLRIKGLESAVGTPLLVRRAQGVAPTPAGQVLVEHARRCFAQLEQMHADLLPYAQGLTGHVKLFANNNAISSYIPSDLARFFAQHPAARITLEERMSHDIVAAISAGRADVGVVALDIDYPNLIFLPYHEDELVLVASRGSALAKQQAINFADCLDEPFISLAHGSALHTFLVNHASAMGRALDIRVQVSGYRAIARLVASGAGVGIVPRSALENSDSDSLAVIDLTDAWAKRDLRICVQRDPAESNHFRDKLVEILCDHADAPADAST
ncbi:MAG: LysR substrate-binding domain-containing protein [Alcaligenaceae bacterium]|nr:LysR substrate-binding domain-containing protein [Alcaligenaceae bacterium]